MSAETIYDSMAVRTLFEKTNLRNEDIASYEYRRFPATEAPTVAPASNPTYFDIPLKVSSLDTMLMLERADLCIGYNVYQNAADLALGGDNRTALISPAHIFQSCAMSLNDQQVQYNNNPGHIYLVDKLINDDPHYLETESSLSKFYRPAVNATIADTNVLAGATALSVDNNAGVIYARIPLRDLFSILKVDKGLMGGQVSFRFTPQTSFAKALFTDGTALAAFIRIKSLYIACPVVRANVDITSDNWNRLKKGDAIRFAYEHREYFASTLTAQNAVVENRAQFAVNSARPSAVVALMQADARQAVTGNNQVGDLYALLSHRLAVNGDVYPESFDMGGSTRGYIPEYIYYQQLSGRNRSNDSAPPVSFKDWKALFPLICYDLSYARDEFGHARSSSANLEWTAQINNSNAASTVHFVVYSHRYVELRNINGQMSVSHIESML